MSDQSEERYLIISADCHAGLPTEEYRPYVDPGFREAFDDMIRERQSITRTLSDPEFAEHWMEENKEGISGAWNGARRDKELDADGVVGEVIFPDGDAVTGFTGSPFGAGLSSTGQLDPGLAMAGARAHNRWLAELCADSPVRRAGVAITPVLDDPDAAIAEAEWAAANGLRGVLIPTMWQPYPAYHDPRYDRFWAACADLNLPVHTHSGAAMSEDYGEHVALYLMECRWWPARPLWFLMWSGVFERHPNLRFGVTESSAYWVPDLLWLMDTRYEHAHTSKKISRSKIIGELTMRPTEYFDRNCFIGASTPERIEVERRYHIGLDVFLWGNDFPHPEGTWPHTRDWLSRNFGDVPVAETRKMLGLNAARVYDFDVEQLGPLADEIGPTPTDLGQVDDGANVVKWADAAARGRFWLHADGEVDR
ncbi:MAG TPA: amidohydrolase family protein [Acidimicrobiales bacterium]|nr:amidohydrolase family protein [Acidimicrobiales bacterium]